MKIGTRTDSFINFAVMKRVFIVSLLALAASLLVAGCCACRKGKNNMPLVGTKWHLVRLMERDLNISDEQFVFTFAEDGSFSGMAACNQMMGKYSTTATGGLKLSDLASTRRMCPEADLEVQFSQILERVTHYEVDGDMLLLLSDGELQAVLQAQK